MDHCALLVIDIQNDFVDGLPEEINVAKVLKSAKKAIDYFRINKKPIVHFREMHRVGKVDYGRELDGDEGVHTVEGTRGADYYEGFEPRKNEYRIDKRRYSGFVGTDLELLLKGLKVDTIYVIGLLTNVCVHYTCADAHQKDYYLKVLEDAVAGSSVESHNAALEAINYLQHGSVIKTDDLV